VCPFEREVVQMWELKRRSFGDEKSQKQGKEARKGKKTSC
jgi:hypothetical protein